jgi:hypothetical protein
MRLSDCNVGDVVRLPLENNSIFSLSENYTYFIDVTILGKGLIGWEKDQRNISHRYSGSLLPENIKEEYKQKYPHLASQIRIGSHCPCKLITSKKQASVLPLTIAISNTLFKILCPSKDKVLQNETLKL